MVASLLWFYCNKMDADMQSYSGFIKVSSDTSPTQSVARVPYRSLFAFILYNISLDLIVSASTKKLSGVKESCHILYGINLSADSSESNPDIPLSFLFQSVSI